VSDDPVSPQDRVDGAREALERRRMDARAEAVSQAHANAARREKTAKRTRKRTKKMASGVLAEFQAHGAAHTTTFLTWMAVGGAAVVALDMFANRHRGRA